MCGRGQCGAAAPALLPHVALLLAAVGGATLATAARLKWDPSTYAPLRELFPVEYCVTAGWLAAAGVALVLQGHLVAAAYSALMATLLVCETVYAAWVWQRIDAWLRSERARALHDALALREHLNPLLEALSRWHPLPTKVKDLILEAEADGPRNGYVAAAACALLLVLQVTGLVLALLAAARTTETTAPLISVHRSGSDEERAPLKAEFRNGRLVMV